jgi:membrane-associated protease RseP (regulator of RpoE activity)
VGLLGVLAFIFALLFSVMVHEFGHYITAKRFGMRVTEFFLGFGARIWSTQRGETEFGLKAIPAGGYCKISGMTPNEEMPEEVKSRAFYKAKTSEKLIVLGAGSFLHFVLGFLLLFTLFFGVGVNRVLPTITEVVPCVATTNQCTPNDPVSPAKNAGLQVGDEITGVNGQRNLDWEETIEIVQKSAGKELTLIVLRAGNELEVKLTPASRLVDGQEIGFLGVRNEIGKVKEGPISALSLSASTTYEIVKGSLKALLGLPSKIPTLFNEAFLGQERDGQGLVGVVGVARVSGETASSGNLTASEKVATFILLVASLNVFVGIFNLLPILPLDGGHIAVAIYENLRNRVYRIRGKEIPGPVDVEKLTPITMVVLVLLVALTVLLLFADIFNPINFNI